MIDVFRFHFHFIDLRFEIKQEFLEVNFMDFDVLLYLIDYLIIAIHFLKLSFLDSTSTSCQARLEIFH